MTREEIIEKLKAMEPELRARGITRLQMFGSRARGDNRENSDLDLLVEIDPQRKLSLFDITGIHLDLTEILGMETYLIEPDALKPRFRQQIDEDLVPVLS